MTPRNTKAQMVRELKEQFERGELTVKDFDITIWSLLEKKQRDVFQSVKRGYCTSVEVAQDVGISIQYASSALGQLYQLGFLEREKTVKGFVYRPTATKQP